MLAGFWQIQAGTPILTVDDADSLRDAAALLQAARAVGIDCEWQPGSSRPSATLLQLAVRTDAAACTVLILVRSSAATCLQQCTSPRHGAVLQPGRLFRR